MNYQNIKVESFSELIVDEYINNYNEEKPNKIIDTGNIALFTTRQSFSIFQFQPEEVLCVDSDNGISAKEKNHYIKKYNAFIDLSFKDTYALVLTPEYSVPKETLEYLLKNQDKIKPGSLYCICCEGMNFNDYEVFYKKLCNNFDIFANDIIVRSIIPDRLVCVMFYIAKIRFKLTNREPLDTVFLVPQFKVNQMRDPNFDYETSGLTLGNSLLYFGEKNGPKFMSMICADSYNLDVIQKIQAFGDNDLLVFNPQLNQGANNSIFNLMRSNLFEYCKDRIRVISLNWANNTKLIIDGNESKLTNPKSGYYFEFLKSEFDNILNIYPKNAFWGFEFSTKETIGFWEVFHNENAVSYNIDAFRISANPRFATKNRELKAKKMWIYKNDVFIELNKTCQKEIDDFFKSNKEFEQLIICNDCLKKECSKCKLNEFSASIFDKKLIEEYDTIYKENSNSLYCKQSNNSINEKLIICRKILYMIKNGLISSRFKLVEKEIKFVIQKEHDLTYNIVFIDNDENLGTNEIPCRIVYLKYAEKHIAINKYNNLVKEYGKENKDNIMVLYESDEGCKVIPERNSSSILDKNESDININIS